MKKLFSLLTLALLSMTVWGKVVTVDFAGMYESNTNLTTINAGEGITLTFSKANGSNVPAYNANAQEVRMYKNTTLSVAAPEGYTITNIDFTFTQSRWQQSPSSANVGTIGSDGNWTGSANSVLFTNNYETNTQIRFNKMEITFNEPTVDGLVAPVFTPGSCEFSQNTLTVTVSCPTTNATMAIYKVVDGEIDWSTYEYAFQSKELYVNETTTYAAQAYYEGEESEWVYATYTKVTPKVATPTFNPASGAEFADELDVTISCATPGATIMYEYGDVMDEAVAPVTITLTDNATISAIASLEGYEDSETATATYTKMTVVPAAGTYTLVSDVTTLQAGDKIALVGMKNNVAYVMSTKRSNNFGGVEIVLEDNKFTTDKAANITLEQNDSVWNLKVSAFDEDGVHVQGYLFAAGANSNNYMRVEDAVDNNGNANALITNGDNNEAVIEFQNGKTRNIVRFNDNNSETTPTLFSCYETGKQKPVYIYKLTDGEVIVPAAPTITPESQEFTEPIEVTITNNDENGAVVMYAINDGEYAEYEAPFTVSETTTVKAYAVNNGATSAVVEATYTYVPATVTVADLAAVEALDSAAVFTFTGNIVVTHKNGKNLWVRDESGSALIYDTTDDSIVKGVVVASNWGGTKDIYNGKTEIKNLKDFAASGTTQEVAPFERQTLTMDNYAEYVIIKNVSIDSSYVSGNKTNYVTNTGVTVRLNWTNVAFTPVEGATYDFIGVVSAYKGEPQMYLIEYTVNGGVEPEVPEVASIAAAEALDLNTKFSYIGEAVVVYHPASDLRYTYIYDGENYGLIYDGAKSIPAMDKGTVLKDEWTAVLATYNGAFQFTNPEGVEASDDEPVAINPIEMTDVTLADAHKYIMMKGQTLTSTANKTWANADGLLFYNRFNLDLNIEDGKTYDVEAMVGTYKVNDEFIPEIFIISATEAAAQEWALGDVNHDTFVNVADVTALIKYVLTSGDEPEVFYTEQANVDGDAAGIFNVADVTALIQLVLNQ